MLEGFDNLGDFSVYNITGFSFVTLWVSISLVSVVLDVYQDSYGIHHNKQY